MVLLRLIGTPAAATGALAAIGLAASTLVGQAAPGACQVADAVPARGLTSSTGGRSEPADAPAWGSWPARPGVKGPRDGPGLEPAAAPGCLGVRVYVPLVVAPYRAPRPTVPVATGWPTCLPTTTRTPTGGSVTPGPSATSGPSATASRTVTSMPSPATVTSGPSPTPTASTTATPRAFPPHAFTLGVQVFESDLEGIQLGRFDDVGAGLVRARVLWSAVEPNDHSPPIRDWSMSDAIVRASADRGLTVLLNLYDNPAWAASTSCGPIDRAPLSRYADFVFETVERYDADGFRDAPGSPLVAAYEIFNEPDFDRAANAANPWFGDPVDGYGGCFGHDPAAYAEVLRAAWLAARSADSLAIVVFGAVAYDRFVDNEAFSPAGPFRYAFVRDVILASYARYGREPGWPFFDFMAFHNYNEFRDNWDGADERRPEIVGKAAHLRANQLRWAGAPDLSGMPLLCTEVGMASAPSDEWTERSEGLQAAYVGQAMVRSLAADLSLAVWYSAEDYATGACDRPTDWLAVGLLRSTWVASAASACARSPLPGYLVGAPHEPKPSHGAFGVASRLLTGVAHEHHLTVAETLDPVIEAHRVRLPDGRRALVAFTDTGERLGRRGGTTRTAELVVGPELLPGWTGRVRVTESDGQARTVAGASLVVALGPAPTYVEVLP